MIYFKIILVVLVFQFPNLLKAQDLINSSEVEEKQLTEDILITVLRNNSFVKNKCYLFYDIRENNSKYKKTIENKIIRCLPFAITETNDSNFLSIKNKISAGIDTNFLYISMDFEKKQIDSSLLVLSQILYNKGIENAKNIATNNQNSVEFNRLKNVQNQNFTDCNHLFNSLKQQLCRPGMLQSKIGLLFYFGGEKCIL